MGEGDKKSPLNSSSFWENYLCDHFSSQAQSGLKLWQFMCHKPPNHKALQRVLGSKQHEKESHEWFACSPLSTFIAPRVS